MLGGILYLEGHCIGRGSVFGGTLYWERYCIWRDTVLGEIQYSEGHSIIGICTVFGGTL